MDIHLNPGALAEQMAADVRAGLLQIPKTLPPKYFYDAHGSELFDRITRLPEYYPTRAERAILAERAEEIAAVTGAQSLVELGSGTSEKTRLLLSALRDAGTLTSFVPFDVDPAVLKDASAAVGVEFPGVTVEPVVGDFEKHLGELPRHPKRLVAFLGSTIGNLDPEQRAGFLADVRGILRDGDHLLLGTDLVKSPDRLVAAYDDAEGVTAAFDKNVLSVVNRDLGGDFDLDAFEHVSVWVAEHEWIEMRLRSLRDQVVHVRGLGLDVHFARGEEMRTEISSKFRRERVEAELAAAGWNFVDGGRIRTETSRSRCRYLHTERHDPCDITEVSSDRTYRVVIRAFRAVFALLGLHFDVRGVENVPADGPAVLACNHLSYLDFTFAGLAASHRGRLVRFMAKTAVFENRVAGPLMRAMGHIPVDRASGAAAYRRAARKLAAGELVGIFPEATISRSCTLKSFKLGAATLAVRERVPLVPVVLWAPQRTFSVDKHYSLRRGKTIMVLLGEPIGTAPDDDPTKVDAELRERMTALLQVAWRDYPDRPRDEADRWWVPLSQGGTAPTVEQASELEAAALVRRAARKAASGSGG